jgi:hypothetical protein
VRVLLVEPDYLYHKRSRNKLEKLRPGEHEPQKRFNDDVLWYPPLGLMKLSTFHKNRGDFVHFVHGMDKEAVKDPDLFNPYWWDRVYISTLFTYEWKETIKTIEFYKRAVGNTFEKIYIGGIMASLMEKDIYNVAAIAPFAGIVSSPSQLNLDGEENIDQLTPDYGILDNQFYAINNTYYGHTSRGCVNHCSFCGVPKIEPEFVPYIDIKDMIRALRKTPGDKYGDKPKLKLMDNNVLASPSLEQIVDDLLELGYGKDTFTDTKKKRRRVIDFNQGLDANFFTEENINLISKLNIEPMRIAFDHVRDKEAYENAVKLAYKYGFTKFSNYMLFNWKDTPKDLYDRLIINIQLNESWRDSNGKDASASIYCYPMRYAPILDKNSDNANRSRDFFAADPERNRDLLNDTIWNPRFVRNIEIMKSAANGAISPVPSLALRTIGRNYEEYLANLYMPGELLRNRNKYEKHVYEDEPERKPGTGDVEEFRSFLLELIRNGGPELSNFHAAISANTLSAVQAYYNECDNEEIKKWLKFYLKK